MQGVRKTEAWILSLNTLVMFGRNLFGDVFFFCFTNDSLMGVCVLFVFVSCKYIPFLFLHRGRLTWNLKITKSKGKIHLPNLRFLGFKMLIFPGVYILSYFMVF